MTWAARFLGAFRSALERRILGLSAEEIRYTIDDVRAEIRATRTELLDEIAKLRAEVELMSSGTHPPGTGDRTHSEDETDADGRRPH